MIPENILKTVTCICKKGWNSKKCGYRKHGHKCTNLCTNYHCLDKCSNVEDLSDLGTTEKELPMNVSACNDYKNPEEESGLDDPVDTEYLENSFELEFEEPQQKTKSV